MPNLAVTFRQEITRLARRETRGQTQGLRKASAQFRRDIAELKGHATELESQVARLGRRIGKDVVPAIAEADLVKIRFNARSVISQRRNLGLSAADYGKLVGVTGHTVYKWEHGTSRPRRTQLSAFASTCPACESRFGGFRCVMCGAAQKSWQLRVIVCHRGC